MKRVLITGINGFIGSHLSAKFLSEGYEVVGIDVSTETSPLFNKLNFSNQSIEYHKMDLAEDNFKLEKIITECDLVIHLAAIVGIPNYLDFPLQLFKTNILGSWNVIQYCLKHNKRLVFSSTSEIFGKNPKVPWEEDADRILGSTEKDRWGYSTSKATIEHLLHSLVNQLDYRVVRFFNVYGPGQNPIFLVSRNIKRALREEPLEIFDQGSQTRCLTYVEDAVDATFRVAVSPVQNRIFNVGSESEQTILEIVSIISNEFGGAPLVNIDTSKTYGATYEDLDRRIPSSKRVFEELGWKATTSAQTGIVKTIEWAKANEWWWRD